MTAGTAGTAGPSEAPATPPHEPVPDIEAAAALIDETLEAVSRDRLTADRAVERISTITSEVIRFAPSPTEDIVLLADYAREVISDIAYGVELDPVLVEYFEDTLGGELLVDTMRAQLESLLEPIEHAAGDGDAEATAALVDLCRRGRRTHRLTLRIRGVPERILRAAHRLSVTDALHAAVSPRFVADGAIANRNRDMKRFTLAMDLLAHLAAHPDNGSAARNALLDLTSYVETAGEAVTRLPLHLLNDDDRQRLLDVHEARLDLFSADPVQHPLGLALLRDNRVVQTAMWQAFDAKHIP